MILVTGASSSPGYWIVKRLMEEGREVLPLYNQHRPPLPGARQVDLAKPGVAYSLVAEHKPEAVVHAAALGDVDRCEEDREYCYRVNVLATRELARACSRMGSYLVYISTDYVFDGARGFYKPEDPPKPINYYGLTKLLGEEAVLAAGGVALRAAWIYGVGPGRPNFGRTVVEKLSRGEEVTAVVDQWGSPTLNVLIGEAVARALKRGLEGQVIHAAGPRMSRYQFALAIAEAFGFPKELVKPIRLADLKFKAPRPVDSSLVNNAGEVLGVATDDLALAMRLFKESWEEFKKAASP